MLKFLKSSLASTMIVALVATTSPIAAYAKLIGTDEVVTTQSVEAAGSPFDLDEGV